MGVRILNLGAGNRPLKGAVNHDRIKHRLEIDMVHDLNVLPWPWKANSLDQIVARSVFEHLDLDLVQVMDECWRILRSGGRLDVKVPHWQHDNAYADPTHRWRYSLRSFDVFLPDTALGKEHSFYTARKWQLLKGPKLNGAKSSLFITLRPVK